VHRHAEVAALLLCEAAVAGPAGGGALGVCGWGKALRWLWGGSCSLDNSLLIGGMVWPAGLWVVPALALVVSLASAVLPTVAAYRVSVLRLLESR